MESLGFAVVALLIALYLLPTIIASMRNAGHGWSIMFLNLIFGWTGIGWLVVAIWACTDTPKAPEES